MLHSDVHMTMYGALFSLLHHQHAILFLQLCCHCGLEESAVSLSSLSVDFTVPLSTYNLLQNFSITLDEPIKTQTITPFFCISLKLIQPFKAKWLLYAPPRLTLTNSTFCPHSCIYVFCVDLRTNSNYYPVQH